MVRAGKESLICFFISGAETHVGEGVSCMPGYWTQISHQCSKNPSIILRVHTSVIAGWQIKREMPFQLWGDSGGQHTHTHSITQSRRRVSRWALSQAAKQITSRYDICRQADRGGRSVPAGREQQLAAPSPGISSPSRERERHGSEGERRALTGVSNFVFMHIQFLQAI